MFKHQMQYLDIEYLQEKYIDIFVDKTVKFHYNGNILLHD